MKRSRTLVLSAAFVLALALPSFAEEIQGVVASVDSSQNSIVVTDPVSGQGRAVRVHPKVIADIQNGTVVKATLKPGTDEASSVEVILTKPRA